MASEMQWVVRFGRRNLPSSRSHHRSLLLCRRTEVCVGMRVNRCAKDETDHIGSIWHGFRPMRSVKDTKHRSRGQQSSLFACVCVVQLIWKCHLSYALSHGGD